MQTRSIILYGFFYLKITAKILETIFFYLFGFKCPPSDDDLFFLTLGNLYALVK